MSMSFCKTPPGGGVSSQATPPVISLYVIWIGVAFYILFAISMFKMLQDGPPDGERSPEKPAKPTAASSV
jgi:hypothetical protein